MRSGIVLVALLFATTAALGRHAVVPKPLPQGRVFLDLSNLHLHLFHEQDPAASDSSAQSADPQTQWSQGVTLPNLSMGPLHAQIGSDENPRANLSIYKLQGEDQLGSSVWHNQEGRQARILFIWPTDK
jgi:hypothetical protein